MNTRSSSRSPGPSRPRAGAHGRWARRWFSGTTICPHCGATQVRRAVSRAGGDTRIETWICRCGGQWLVELRESALAVIDLASDVPTRWIERQGPQKPPVYRIIVEDGVVQGIRVQKRQSSKGPHPQFVLREYDDSLEEDRVSGIDEAQRKYYEHPVDILDEDP